MPLMPRRLDTQPSFIEPSSNSSSTWPVVDDRQAQGRAVAQRLTHHIRVGHRPAVVAEADSAGLGQAPPSRPAPTPCCPWLRTRWAARAPRPLSRAFRSTKSTVALESINGLVLGMAQMVMKPALCRCPRARSYRLLVLVAGLPQMAVKVDEPSAYDKPGRIDHLGAVGPGISASSPLDDAIPYEQVGDPVGPPGWGRWCGPL